VVTRTVAQEAIPRGRLPAWLVTDARAELMTQIRRLAREPRSRGSRNVALWPVRLWGSDLQDLHSYSLLIRGDALDTGLCPRKNWLGWPWARDQAKRSPGADRPQ